MVLWHALLGADVTELIQLRIVFSAYAFSLSGCVVETRASSGAGRPGASFCEKGECRNGRMYCWFSSA
jgi:hypothetical protein